ncbi:hypothetical protein AB5I41_19755 [Sphingomonas sp. MMS24-JH45]
MMFVADWCAPCHGEVARLGEIAAAAPSWRVMVADGDVPTQTGRLVRGVAAERRWIPDAATIARMRRDLLAGVPGLPYSIAFGARRGPSPTIAARSMRRGRARDAGRLPATITKVT